MSGKGAVSKVRPTKAEPAPPSVRPVLVAASSVEESTPTKKVVLAPAAGVRGLRPSLEAWQRIARPLRAGQGIRVVVYGITGKGKTTGLKEFLEFITREGLIDLVFVHDVKLREPQYEGEIIHEARDVYTSELAPDTWPAVRVLRKRNLDHMPSVDAAARVTLESADEGVQTMLLVDEFQRAIDEDVPGGFMKGSCNRIASEGRGIGASLIAVKQLPQFMPTGVRSQSDLVFFGVAGDGVTHLVDEKVVDARMGVVLSQLRVGQFVVKPCEGDFDGQVFQVPAPR